MKGKQESKNMIGLDRTIIEYKNYSELNINNEYDYIKFFIINNLVYYSSNFFNTQTEYNKLLGINPNIYKNVRDNSVYKFFNSIITYKNGEIKQNITYKFILCKIVDSVFSGLNVKNNISIISVNDIGCGKLNITDKIGNMDIILTPHTYLHNKKHNILNDIDTSYKEKVLVIGDYSVAKFKEYLSGVKLCITKDNKLNISKYYDLSHVSYKDTLNLCSPNLKYIVNSSIYLSLILNNIIRLKNGGDNLIYIKSYITPVLRKIINLLHNIFSTVEYYDVNEYGIILCKNLNITDNQRIAFIKLLITLIDDEKIFNHYYEPDDFLNIHLNNIVKGKSFYYTLPQNIIDKYLRNFKTDSKYINAKFINDINLSNSTDEYIKSIANLFDTVSVKSDYITNKIHNKAVNDLFKINGHIIDHDIKFGEGNYDIDEEFINKVLYDKYETIMQIYKRNNIVYNKSYDVFINQHRGLQLDKFYSFNSNINTRLIKYNMSELKVIEGIKTYYYDHMATYYKQLDYSYKLRNLLSEESGVSGLNTQELDIIVRVFSQFTRGISAYISRWFPMPSTISNNAKVSNAFCKLWEIYHKFEIFDGYKKGELPRVFHFCEAPGQWIITTRYFLSKRHPEFMIMPSDNNADKHNSVNIANAVAGGGNIGKNKLKNKLKNKMKITMKVYKNAGKIPRKTNTKKLIARKSNKYSQKRRENVAGILQKQPDKIADYNWRANSLNPNCELNYQVFGSAFTIKDDYKIIKNNINRWIWGADNTGNIFYPHNIRWYRDYCKKWGGTTLVTGDAGLSTHESDLVDLQKLDYAQMVMVAATCGIGGACVIKHFTPYFGKNYDASIKACGTFYNMIYTYYQIFDEVALFKPYCSNPNSGEFYLVGKGFNGISDSNLDNLLNILDNFTLNQCWVSEDDIPYKFISQVNNFLKDMSEIYKFTLDTSVLIRTCLKDKNSEFRRISKCYDFLDEKKIYKIQEPQFKKWIKEYKFI